MLTALIVGLGIALPIGLVATKWTRLRVLKQGISKLDSRLIKKNLEIEGYASLLVLLSVGMLLSLQVNSEASFIALSLASAYPVVYLAIASLMQLNVRTVQYIFSKEDIAMLVKLHEWYQADKRPNITSKKMGEYCVFVDDMLVEEFLLHELRDELFLFALKTKENLNTFKHYQDEKALSGLHGYAEQNYEALVKELVVEFIILRKHLGTVKKPVTVDKKPVQIEMTRQDPVLENISELLSSEAVAPDKKEKLEALQQDVMQKLEESKQNYSRDMEADAVLIAGATYHRLNKTY